MKTEDHGKSLRKLFKEVSELTDVLQTARIIPNNHHEVELLSTYLSYPLHQIKTFINERTEIFESEVKRFSRKLFNDLEYLSEYGISDAKGIYQDLQKKGHC